MNNSKLFELLNTFNESELNQFNQFLNLYRSNKEIVVVRLFDYVYNNFKQREFIKKETVFNHLFPQLCNTPQKMDH